MTKGVYYKKNLSVLVIILLVVLVGTGCYIFYQYKSFNYLNKKYNDIKNKSGNTSITSQSNILKEGYIVYKTVKNEQYKIYGIGSYVSESGIIIGYNNSLYYLHSSDDFKDIGMISTVSFDSNNIYSNSGTYIRKYKGNEKDLLKVTFSRSVLNTDGSPYPILIYKDGSIESIEEVEKN